MKTLMTPCHFQGVEASCEQCETYQSRCTHQAFGEFCRNIDIQKQLNIRQPRFVSENSIRIGYPGRQGHETNLEFNRHLTTVDYI
jgi:hypothetical protein